jgi:hypothetical protein
VALALGAMTPSGKASANTRGFAISDFHTATYADNASCIHGGNGASVDIRRRVLLRLGYTTAQANQMLVDRKNSAGVSVEELLYHRGINNSRVDPFNNPQDALDPKIELAGGRFAPGFDLDNNPNTGFEDPETHQRGIDNQLFRALGCFAAYQVNLPVHPMYEHVMWDTQFDTMPAWVIYISGTNLTANGPVEITFDRSTQHLRRNTLGGALVNATFVVAARSRSTSKFKGEIRDGYLYVNSGTLSLEGEAPILTEVNLREFHARIKIEPDGSLTGLMGGYQPWMDFFYFVSAATEVIIGVDVPGVYYALKHLADHAPDPKTGQNTEISAAYHFTAVPAFLANTQGTVFASGAGDSASESAVASLRSKSP